MSPCRFDRDNVEKSQRTPPIDPSGAPPRRLLTVDISDKTDDRLARPSFGFNTVQCESDSAVINENNARSNARARTTFKMAKKKLFLKKKFFFLLTLCKSYANWPQKKKKKKKENFL